MGAQTFSAAGTLLVWTRGKWAGFADTQSESQPPVNVANPDFSAKAVSRSHDLGHAGHRKGIPSIGVGFDGRFGIEAGHGLDGGHDDLRVDRFLPGDFIARIGRHPAKNRGHRALGAPFALRGYAAGTQIGEQVVMLLLVAVAAAVAEVVDDLIVVIINL